MPLFYFASVSWNRSIAFAGETRIAVLPVHFLVVVLISVERTVCGRYTVLGAEIADALYNIGRRVIIHLDKVDGVAHTGVAVVVVVDIVARDERQPSSALDMYTVLDAALCRLDCDVGDSLAANTGCSSVLHLSLPVTRNANPIEYIADCSGGSGSRSSRQLGDGYNTADLFGDLSVVRSDEAADVSAVDLHGSFADDTVACVTLGDGKSVSVEINSMHKDFETDEYEKIHAYLFNLN